MSNQSLIFAIPEGAEVEVHFAQRYTCTGVVDTLDSEARQGLFALRHERANGESMRHVARACDVIAFSMTFASM